MCPAANSPGDRTSTKTSRGLSKHAKGLKELETRRGLRETLRRSRGLGQVACGALPRRTICRIQKLLHVQRRDASHAADLRIAWHAYAPPEPKPEGAGIAGKSIPSAQRVRPMALHSPAESAALVRFDSIHLVCSRMLYLGKTNHDPETTLLKAGKDRAFMLRVGEGICFAARPCPLLARPAGRGPASCRKSSSKWRYASHPPEKRKQQHGRGSAKRAQGCLFVEGPAAVRASGHRQPLAVKSAERFFAQRHLTMSDSITFPPEAKLAALISFCSSAASRPRPAMPCPGRPSGSACLFVGFRIRRTLKCDISGLALQISDGSRLCCKDGLAESQRP